jgi:hypothetical protein
LDKEAGQVLGLCRRAADEKVDKAMEGLASAIGLVKTTAVIAIADGDLRVYCDGVLTYELPDGLSTVEVRNFAGSVGNWPRLLKDVHVIPNRVPDYLRTPEQIQAMRAMNSESPYWPFTPSQTDELRASDSPLDLDDLDSDVFESRKVPEGIQPYTVVDGETQPDFGDLLRSVTPNFAKRMREFKLTLARQYAGPVKPSDRPMRTFVGEGYREIDISADKPTLGDEYWIGPKPADVVEWLPIENEFEWGWDAKLVYRRRAMYHVSCLASRPMPPLDNGDEFFVWTNRLIYKVVNGEYRVCEYAVNYHPDSISEAVPGQLAVADGEVWRWDNGCWNQESNDLLELHRAIAKSRSQVKAGPVSVVFNGGMGELKAALGNLAAIADDKVAIGCEGSSVLLDGWRGC